MAYKVCSVDGCWEWVIAKDLCSKHYTRVRRTGKTEREPMRLCEKKGCTNKHNANGLCSRCYAKERYRNFRMMGICARCGETKTDKPYCDPCNEIVADNLSKRKEKVGC